MRIIRVFFVVAMLTAMVSCNGGRDGGASAVDTTAKPRVAQVVAATAVPALKHPALKPVFVERGRLQEAGQTFIVASRYMVPDTLVSDRDSGNLSSTTYLLVLHTGGKQPDTVDLGWREDDLVGCASCKLIIEDLMDSLGFKSPVIQVIAPVEEPSDSYFQNTFVGYKDGKWEILFSIGDYDPNGIRFHRTGENTITGLTTGLDNVVEQYERDYLFNVNTITFETWKVDPERQYIGYKTTTAEGFRAHRIRNGIVDSSLVTVKSGAEVIVDTLYRKLDKVRIWLRDSSDEFEIRVGTARKKLVYSTPG
jgi:hypothetical protein